MKIIGVSGKLGSIDNASFNFPTGESWKGIHFTNSDVSLNIYYNTASPVLIINDSKWTLLSDDGLYILENQIPRKPAVDDIANMLEKEGILFIDKIISDFNMFLYDKTRGDIHLVSNRTTTGRMFYVFWKDAVFFSNEFRLLMNIKELNINPYAVYAYTKYGAVPEDITFDTDIKSVPIGHYATIDREGRQAKYAPFYKFNYDDNTDYIKDPHELLSSVAQVLKANAKALSNEQVHILMSGGIDSSLFTAYLKEYTSNIIGHYCRFGYDVEGQQYAEMIAGKLNVPLRIHSIHNEQIIQEVEDTAFNTIYPHSDYSKVAENFLLRKIKEEFGPGQLVIDCNGGDDGFGHVGLTNIAVWEKLYKIPTGILRTLGKLTAVRDNWMYDSIIGRILFSLYRAVDKNLYISHMTISAGERLFRNGDRYDKELQKMITGFFNNNLEGESPSSYARMSIAQFYHINSRLWTAKGYGPARSMNINLVFPFTWKNVLDRQCKIPLSMKVYKGEVKWPLKKLLEEYMPYDFIYKEKIAFTPPLYQWLKTKKNHTYFYETVMNGVLAKDLDISKVDKIFKLIKTNRKISHYATNLIWLLFFFEIWLAKHKLHK